MTINGWLQILLYSLIILAVTKPLGVYMYRVFESPVRPLPRVFGPLERWSFRLCGVDAENEQTWTGYAQALLLFSLVGLLVTLPHFKAATSLALQSPSVWGRGP